MFHFQEYIFCLAAALALHTCTALPKIEIERTGFSHEQDSSPIRGFSHEQNGFSHEQDSLPVHETYSQQHIGQQLPQFRHHDSKHHDSKEHDSQSVRNHESHEHKLTPLPLLSHNVPSYGTLSHDNIITLSQKPSLARDHVNPDTVHGKKTLSMHEEYTPQLASYQQLPPVRQITSLRPFSIVQEDDHSSERRSKQFEHSHNARRQGVVGDQFVEVSGKYFNFFV